MYEISIVQFNDDVRKIKCDSSQRIKRIFDQAKKDGVKTIIVRLFDEVIWLWGNDNTRLGKFQKEIMDINPRPDSDAGISFVEGYRGGPAFYFGSPRTMAESFVFSGFKDCVCKVF